MNKFITHTVLFLLYSYIFSQNRINDAGGWLSLGAKYELNSKQEVTGMLRFRQYENFTMLNSWYVDVGYAYKISEVLKVSIHYALNPTRTKDNYFRNLHQYYIRADYKKFINKYFTICNRLIIQHTNRFIVDMDNGYKPYYRTDFRARLGFSYHLSAASNIFFHNEWMYTLSEGPVELKRNRVYTGYEKEVNNFLSVKIYFVLQSSFHKQKSPNTNHFIYGIDLNFKLN